jgi:hypothetical protein
MHRLAVFGPLKVGFRLRERASATCPSFAIATGVGGAAVPLQFYPAMLLPPFKYCSMSAKVAL